MTVALSDYIKSLQREVLPLGAMPPASVSNTMWTGYLSDAFWEARLDGFLTGFTEADGDVDPINPGSPDMGRAEVALVILYAGVRVLRNQVLNTKTSFRAKAGNTEFEQQSSATMLAEMLKQLERRKLILLERADAVGTAVAMYDLFSARSYGFELGGGGYYAHPELAG